VTTGSFGGYSIRRFSPERGALGKLFARDSAVRRMDWVMVVAAVLLSGLGSLLVWSATRGRTTINHGDPQYFLIRHLMNLAIGLGLAVGTILVGHRRLRSVIPFLYGISILLLLAVLSPLGSTVNGAHSWIVIGGGFSIQPSEFAKITIILGMAMILSGRVDAGDRANPDHRSVLQSLGLAVVPMGVIMLMPDLGSTMVMVVIVLGVLLSYGV
jgi:rod shape determining protein RodA